MEQGDEGFVCDAGRMVKPHGQVEEDGAARQRGKDRMDQDDAEICKISRESEAFQRNEECDAEQDCSGSRRSRCPATKGYEEDDSQKNEDCDTDANGSESRYSQEEATTESEEDGMNWGPVSEEYTPSPGHTNSSRSGVVGLAIR